jgi:hypothetical protein
LQKQKEKEEMSMLEKRLQEEKRARFNLEAQLSQEKKQREVQQQQQHQQVMPPSLMTLMTNSADAGHLNNSSSNNHKLTEAGCSDMCCRKKLKELENENRQLNDECRIKQERINSIELDLKTLAKYREAESRAENLMVKLNIVQDKNASLQESLSAETRFKMDLFSALGEARRQLEYSNCKIFLSLILQITLNSLRVLVEVKALCDNFNICFAKFA